MEKLSGDHDAKIAQAKEFLSGCRDETPANLLARSTEQHQAITAEISQLSDEQAAFSPSDEEWSVVEVCSHLSDSIRNTALLAKAMLRGAAPNIPGGIRGGVVDESIVTVEQAMVGLKKGFNAMAEATKRLEEDWDESITTDHPWFGTMNAKQWVAFNLLHVRVHIGQIQRIKASENFPST